MDALRSPGGCPWDGEQTHRSLVRYLIEESYEVVEAIEEPGGVDRALLREELGDVLLQVVFHARIAEEVPAASGGFDVAEVVEELNAKLVRRHPHVFVDAAPAAPADATSAASTPGPPPPCPPTPPRTRRRRGRPPDRRAAPREPDPALGRDQAGGEAGALGPFEGVPPASPPWRWPRRP
ncbi:hypothetical protein NBM05_12530 [Rothia sp. AR01]|uniref:NTP pyrophosphohydrolase MazG-like domain-containing protein n=2 Tax=Rothia santali TaxID=2949643 RepID=A0A9X2KM44_9MICC|nr:hypothetical protein [Rothia santali]